LEFAVNGVTLAALSAITKDSFLVYAPIAWP
jgi:hypothetical protein